MYEPYLAASPNGVTDIDFEIEKDKIGTPSSSHDGRHWSAVKLTVTFAVTTDSEAWMTIDSDGFVYPAFGGTGTPRPELDEYAEYVVEVWRAVTGDTETTCRYKIPDDDDERDQYADEHIIDA